MGVNEVLFIIISVVCGYLFGSIPSALIIGKKFFNTDIREHGSHNLGGTNAGRVLGAKAGVIVMALDIIKNIVAFLLVRYLFSFLFKIDDNTLISNVAYITLTLGVIGHCYPVFASFKGGKAVSAAASFLLSTNLIFSLMFIIYFFLIIKLFKMVSLSSMVTLIIISLCSFIPAVFAGFMFYGLEATLIYSVCISLITILLIYRHRTNIVRIIKKEERKIKWMK